MFISIIMYLPFTANHFVHITIIITTNIADQTNRTVTLDCQYTCAKLNYEAWLKVTSEKEKQDSIAYSSHTPTNLVNVGTCDTTEKRGGKAYYFPEENTRLFSCIRDVTQWCESLTQNSGGVLSPAGGVGAPGCTPIDRDSVVADGGGGCLVQVLVTGSLHLVGTTMNVLGCKVDDL